MDLAPVNVAQEMLEGVAVEEVLADMSDKVALLVRAAVEEVLGVDMAVEEVAEEEVAVEEVAEAVEEEVAAEVEKEDNNKVAYRAELRVENIDTHYRASYKYYKSGLPLRL